MHTRVDVADVTDYLVIIVVAVCACAGGQGSLCGEVELSPLQSSDHCTVTTESVQFIMLLTHILTFLSSPHLSSLHLHPFNLFEFQLFWSLIFILLFQAALSSSV